MFQECMGPLCVQFQCFNSRDRTGEHVERSQDLWTGAAPTQRW